MRIIVFAAAAALSLLATPVHADEEAARNHGYETAALETCNGLLTVTNPQLRAKLDRMYRDTPRWRETFLEGYEAVAHRPRELPCLLVGDAKWLKLAPGAREALNARLSK